MSHSTIQIHDAREIVVTRKEIPLASGGKFQLTSITVTTSDGSTVDFSLFSDAPIVIKEAEDGR